MSQFNMHSSVQAYEFKVAALKRVINRMYVDSLTWCGHKRFLFLINVNFDCCVHEHCTIEQIVLN